MREFDDVMAACDAFMHDRRTELPFGAHYRYPHV
jgi:hypothetical protein